MPQPLQLLYDLRLGALKHDRQKYDRQEHGIFLLRSTELIIMIGVGSRLLDLGLLSVSIPCLKTVAPGSNPPPQHVETQTHTDSHLDL